MHETKTTEPIRVSITVRCPVERAFRVFTEEPSTWWPMRSHSIGEERVASVVMEGRVGGRIYEVADDGSEAEWGVFRVWDPPNRIEYDWNPNPERSVYTYVVTTFEPVEGGTLVSLEHRSWEQLGEEAERVRTSYASDGGWPLVLSQFARAAGDVDDATAR